MPKIAGVAIEKATYAIDKPYDYLVPEDQNILVGCRVLVPFGRGNRTSEGVVVSLRDEVPGKPLKSIRLNLDVEPIVTEREIHLAYWMVKRYFCTFYDAIHAILPSSVWFRYQEKWLVKKDFDTSQLKETELFLYKSLCEESKTTEELQTVYGEKALCLVHRLQALGAVEQDTLFSRKVQDKTMCMASLCVTEQEALSNLKSVRSARAKDAITFLAGNGETAIQDLCYFTGISRQSVKGLEKRGIIFLREVEQFRITKWEHIPEETDLKLNEEQDSVFKEILNECLGEKAGVSLLQGVTGSGKTLVYIRLTQELLKRGKTVMILVPEIALTPQMMSRFSAFFGEDVALLHSALRATERHDQWKRIRQGKCHVVLGTRSAVFAPLENIGLIILDEEQESSYESENAPCYHARDIAKYRCATEGARLLLGSATPTVETAYFAKRGDYRVHYLNKRYNEKNLPDVLIADMRRELRNGNLSLISEELHRELEKNLAVGEQSILFLNRRGASRQFLCPQCGYVPHCPRCSVYLTYHSANERMMCHYCGYSEKATTVCPECGGEMKHIGFGTQKAAEELENLFPDTEILRMDADTVGAGHEAVLRRFVDEKIPILLGTQMVAKGLDFENVTLVGVLSADMGLYVDHYRASERTFSLLTQVVGRAGRGEKAGRAVIQTYTPQNDVIQAAAMQDYERFYDSEIQIRRLRRDPPFADQFVMTVSGPVENDVRVAAAEIAQSLRNYLRQHPEECEKADVFGPAPAPVVKVNNRYRYRIMVVGHNSKNLRFLLSYYMREFSRRGENKNMSIFTDFNLMD